LRDFISRPFFNFDRFYPYKITGSGWKAFQLPLSHRQLAIKLGVRAENISRPLADWHRQGVIAGQRGQ
jgi:CRP-like cAMP-binding protein